MQRDSGLEVGSACVCGSRTVGLRRWWSACVRGGLAGAGEMRIVRAEIGDADCKG